MALDPTFSEAFIHRLAPGFRDGDPWSAHRVVGRQLRPLSLWHLLLLQQIESPLLSQPTRIGGEDILRAVTICRCRFLQAEVKPRWTPWALWKLAGRGLACERAALLDYVEDFLQRPECCSASVGRPGKTIRLGPPPEMIAIASAVIFATGWPERTVWEMPAGAAYWYEALSRRKTDLLDFITPEDRAFEAELEAAGIKPWQPRQPPDDEE